MDDSRTRVIYYHSTRPANWLHRAYIWIHYQLFFKWHMLVHFSNQDLFPMVHQRWDTQETLSANDAEILVWRRMLSTARGLDPVEASDDEQRSLVGTDEHNPSYVDEDGEAS